MTIALDLSAVGAIATYNDFVAHIRDMSDDVEYSRTAIDEALRKVEAHINRVLRVPDMERLVELSLSSGVMTLPNDFLGMRGIRLAGASLVDLRQTTPTALQWTYRGVSGSPQVYAIEGRQIRLAPLPDTATVDMLYFAAITPLTEAIQSNWLLDRHADCYVAGVLYHLASRERDDAAAAARGEEFVTILDAVSAAGNSARWGAGPIIPQGLCQVRGVRT